jgi:hypothetical protein
MGREKFSDHAKNFAQLLFAGFAIGVVIHLIITQRTEQAGVVFAATVVACVVGTFSLSYGAWKHWQNWFHLSVFVLGSLTGLILPRLLFS